MPEETSREIRKLQARLEQFLEGEQAFVQEIRRCISLFKELNQNLEDTKKEMGAKRVQELIYLQLKFLKAFNETLKKGSAAEHEKSHLLKSYGSILLALEEEFARLFDIESEG